MRRTRPRCDLHCIASQQRRDSAFSNRRHSPSRRAALALPFGLPVEAGQSGKLKRWRLPAICVEVRIVSIEAPFN
jgi:hypothetical protein